MSKAITSTETSPKRKPGKGAMNGNSHGKGFTSKRQPTKEQLKAGWAKKRKAAELVKAIFELQFKGLKNSELKKMAAEYFGVNEEDITIEMMLIFRQTEKAIQKADTQAFNAVMNRAYGNKVDITTNDESINQPGTAIDYANLSIEELEQLKAIHEKHSGKD
jgi:hypothetical protein